MIESLPGDPGNFYFNASSEGANMADPSLTRGNLTPYQEILQKAEPFYEQLPSGIVLLNCGDGRGPVNENEALYAKVFGGRDALAWNYMALREYSVPKSIDQTLVETDADFASRGLYKKANIEGGVHSDEHAEGKDVHNIDTSNNDGLVGCGRWQKGEEIASAALEKIDEIILKIKEQAPEVVDGLEEETKALATANADLAHRTLPNGKLVLPNGRQIVTDAMLNGANGLVLAGEHVEEDAVYNLVPNTTNNNKRSQKHFGADGWLNIQFFDANKDEFTFDPRLIVLQDALMAYASKFVLTGTLDGVAVRTT